jgi:hypothetical protein
MPDIVHLPPEFCAPDDAPALTDILSETLVEVGTDLPSRWFPSDDRGAEWAMRNLARFTEQREGVRKQATEWMRQIVEWLEREEKTLARATTYFERVLQQYALARRVIDEDAKTLRLPSGEVRTTARQATLKIVDEAALIAWLKNHAMSAVITVEESVKVTDLKGVAAIVSEPGVWQVGFDCGDTFDTKDPDDLRFCRVCGAEGAVLDLKQIVFATATPVLIGHPAVVIPGVEVEPAQVTAKVVVL